MSRAGSHEDPTTTRLVPGTKDGSTTVDDKNDKNLAVP